MTKNNKLTKKEKKSDCSGKAKVSRAKVKNLLNKGLSRVQIARELGCSRMTIHNIVKEQKLVTAKAITLGAETSVKLLDNNINAMQQLNDVNDLLKSELGRISESLVSCNKGDKKELRDTQIKYLSELRKQLKLLLEIYSTTFEISQVREFQKVVMDVIGELAPEARSEIIKRLKVEQFMRKDML